MPDYTVSTASAPATKYGVYTNTTDATQTTAYTASTRAGEAYKLIASVVGVRTDDFSQVGDYMLEAAFRTSSTGTLTQVGSTRSLHTANEDNAAWDATIDSSGTDIRVRVTGAAGVNISWLVNAQLIRATQYITAAGRIN